MRHPATVLRVLNQRSADEIASYDENELPDRRCRIIELAIDQVFPAIAVLTRETT
jgi:hypothetical protein